MRKGILKKSCAWLLTSVTVLSTVSTSTTGLFADEVDTSATEAYDEQVIDHYECSCGATK